MPKSPEASQVNWKSELNNTAYRYHYLIALVALVLNPLWVIGDYFNIPAHFWDFLYFRLVVSFCILLVLFYSEKLRKYPEIIALVPFVGISIQNAYMYSVMDAVEIQKHTFAYIALFIGAGMFVLWKTFYTILIVVVSFIFNIVFFVVFSKLKVEDVLTNGGLLTLSVALFTILLIKTRTKLTIREIVSRLTLKLTNEQLAEKNEIIENQNEDIISSLNYAQRIQQAILPPLDKISHTFKDSFVLYLPKDIVSGDFYWFSTVNTTPTNMELSKKVHVISAVDCTGHGVPGALMSIIGNTILNQSLKVKEVNTPAQALSFLNHQLIKNLNTIKDGMDMALCAFDLENMVLQYAGANNPLYIIRKGELLEFKADKQAIGGDSVNSELKEFKNHVIPIEKDDAIYIFTDGYADQFGGPESYRGGKKFKYSSFRDLLTEIHEKPMSEQREILLKKHNEWKGELEQVDDILVIGIRV